MDHQTPREQPVGDSLLMIAVRRWWLVALCVLVGAASAGVISSSQPKQYQASARLLFRNDTAPDQSLRSVFGLPSSATAPDPTRQAATNIALVSLDTVAGMAAHALGHGVTTDQVKAEIAIRAVGQSDVVSIVATDPSPARAATLANTFARQFIVFRETADRSLINAALRTVESQLKSLVPKVYAGAGGQALKLRILQLQALDQIQTGNARLVQSASAPASPTSPRTKLNIGAGGLLGLILGVVLAIVFDRLDRRARTPEELAEAYDLPLLGVVPRVKALARRRRGREDAAPAAAPVPMEEAFRAIRARLRYFNVDRELHSVLVTSAAPGEGKSTVAWQLARAIAMTGNGKVLLLETDLRRPALARRHGLRAFPGLAELLFHREALSSIVQSVIVAELVGAAATPESVMDDGPGDAVGAFPLEGEAVFPVEDEFEARGAGAGASNVKPDQYDEVENRPDPSVVTPVGSMDVIVAGDIPPNPSELLESDAMSKLLRRLAEHYDFVILDASPGSLVSDTLPLASQVSGVIVVSSMRHQSPDLVERLRNQLEKVGATMVGVVVNHAKIRREDPYSGYRRTSSSSVAGEGTRAAEVVSDVDAAVDDAPSGGDATTADVSENGAGAPQSTRA